MAACTILIVDDEILVRTNIKMMIDWKNDGFSLYGEASNGSEALLSIRGKPPDIVIADMRMPVMDGLEFSQRFAKQYPQTALIALSNYDDYEYVRGVLKNGAVDYLLKHTLNRTILLEALARAKKLCNSHRLMPLENEIGTENNLAVLKRKFIIQLLEGLYQNEEEVKVHIKALGIRLEADSIIPVVMSVDSGEETAPSMRNSSSMEYAVLNVTQEILDECGNGVVCNISSGLFCILISYVGIPSARVIDDKINTLLWRIQSTLKQFVNLSTRFGVGEICVQPARLPVEFENTKRFFEEQPFSDRSILRRNHDYTPTHRDLSGLAPSLEKELIEAAFSKNTGRMDSVIEHIFDYIQEERLDTVSSQIVFTDILGVADRICKKYGLAQSAIRVRIQALVFLLRSSTNVLKIRQSFQRLFYMIMEYLPRSPEKIYSANIRAALDIIRREFSENISQQIVADKIGISTAYLSTLFNNELGMSFTEYLMNLRLGKAKELFEKGEKNIRKVAVNCGILDYHYFFRVFKRKYNRTPKEFIKQQAAN